MMWEMLIGGKTKLRMNAQIHKSNQLCSWYICFSSLVTKCHTRSSQMWLEKILVLLWNMLGWSMVHEWMLKNSTWNMVLLVCKRIWVRSWHIMILYIKVSSFIHLLQILNVQLSPYYSNLKSKPFQKPGKIWCKTHNDSGLEF